MHILLTNDDGPPCAQSSPYIATLVHALTHAGHTVSVVIPSQQRSWIGKAHLLPPTKGPNTKDKPQKDEKGGESKNEDVSDLIKVRYWIPDKESGIGDGGRVVDVRPEGEGEVGKDYWILVPGTPAACTQLGLFHHSELFPSSSQPQQEQPEFDLVLSGPNLGRNTSAAFALSSGTLGGALEAAVCGRRAIALSFAHYTRSQGNPESQDIIDEACELSVKVVEKLARDWDSMGRHTEGDGERDGGDGGRDGDVRGGRGGRKDPRPDIDSPDLYSINVPLVAGVLTAPVHWTWMLNNRWRNANLYAHVPTTSSALSQQQDSASQTQSNNSAPTFKWQPTFGSVFKTVEESIDGNDGKVIMNKETSITALKACLMDVWGRGGFEGVLKL